jgi:endonuclease YncB( thermonuclease family)
MRKLNRYSKKNNKYAPHNRTIILKTALIIFMVLSFFSAQAETLTGKVVRIADGDTFTLLIDKKQHRIRLYGIDAPETKGGQAYSQKAKEYLSSMIAGKNVKVNIKNIDRYGRYLGIVSTDKIKDVNLEMIKSGMAWHYSYYDNTPSYKEAQQQSKNEKKGLWSDSNPINPYEWRKKH